MKRYLVDVKITFIVDDEGPDLARQQASAAIENECGNHYGLMLGMELYDLTVMTQVHEYEED